MNLQSRLAAILCAFILVAAAAPVTITGQLLAYQDGYVFFTTGDGFRLAPNVVILDEQTKQPAKHAPEPRDYARAVFNAAGEVVEIDLSNKPYPVLPLPEAAQAFAVMASTPYPNPELAPHAPTTANGVPETFTGKLVLVKFEVQVPPTTPINAQVYIATDVSGWNPQAIEMDRIDALHFVAVRRMASGTILHYLYTRGTLQTEEVGPNGLSLKPRELIVYDTDTNSTNSVVDAWADANTNNLLSQPSVFPTPYNPAPFPNLPRGTRTPDP
ncbi:MAG TPA: hypothetical protein VMF11_05455 [Candidatus Baltobacteraceae bacterium]|nr:hypothetical protein [Candidatus Baltobacteraceae bacterium]